MRIEKIIFGLVILLLAGCGNNAVPSDQKLDDSIFINSDQISTIDQTIDCMDTTGISFRYILKYDILKINTAETEKIKSSIKSTVRDMADTLRLIDDCILKKDSIENIIINEIFKKKNSSNTRIHSVIIEIEIPDFLKEAMLPRYNEVKYVRSY